MLRHYLKELWRAESGWRWFRLTCTRWGWDLKMPVGWLVWISADDDWGTRLYWSMDGTPIDRDRIVFYLAAR